MLLVSKITVRVHIHHISGFGIQTTEVLVTLNFKGAMSGKIEEVHKMTSERIVDVL